MKNKFFKKFKLFFPVIALIISFIPSDGYSLQKMSESELGEMTGQTGATFILENFDFFIASPGVTYLESSGGEEDENRDFVRLNDISVHDGFMGPIELSTSLDWDIFSLPIDDVEYNFARFHLYNTAKTPLDITIGSLSIQANPNINNSGTPALVELPGIDIDNLKFNAFTFFLGGASNNIGQAFEIDLNLTIDSTTLNFAEYGVNSGTPVVLNDIRIAGSFTGSEPEYDRSVVVAYSDGLWSEDGAAEHAAGDASYEEALLASCRWVPDPGSWVGSGVLKLGDVEHGNPIRMDIVYDDNYYIPFKYNITSGNEGEDGGAQYYGPAADQYVSDSRGWKDGIDNYSTTETPAQMKNPRYGKTYISQDMPIIGSVRIGNEGGDIVILDGINLQIHAEIPGYGYGDTPNSIPRPFYRDTAPRYDNGNPYGWPQP